MTINEITAKLGVSASIMQQAAIDAIVNSKDNIVLLSPTGSGKTLAYLLPLTQLIDPANAEVQAIVIVPGRELANQSAEVFRSMKTPLRCYSCHGGRPAMDEHREMRRLMPQVIFSTPGRLNDHLDKENILASQTEYIIIDEFDKCLEMGFADEMSRAVSRMPAKARKIFLSATDMTEDSRMTSVLSTRGFSTLDFRMTEDQDKVAISKVQSPEKDKLPTLSKLLRATGSKGTIVFLNYRDSVERTASYLAEEGFSVIAYHGGLDQRQREEAIYRFANGSVNVLVSTDLGSRGLDIPDVANVIHYHMPETEEAYTHRVGRTARWDKTGHTYFILSEGESLPLYVGAQAGDFVIPDALPAPDASSMATLYIGKGKKDKLSKGDIVGFLCKTGGLRGNEIGRIDVYDYYAYAAIKREKLNAVLRNVQGAKIKGHRTKIEEMK